MKRRNRIIASATAGLSLILALVILGSVLLQRGRAIAAAFDLDNLTDEEIRSLFTRISSKVLPDASGPLVYVVDSGADVSLLVRLETDAKGIQYAKQQFAQDPSQVRSLSAEQVLDLLRKHRRIPALLSYWQQKAGQPLLPTELGRPLIYLQSRRCVTVIDESNCRMDVFTWR